jgi:hypothetical protein
MLVQPFGFNATGKSVGRLVAVGQQFGGGSVGAVFGNYPNQYGIIVANEDISGSYAWGNNGTITGTTAAVLSGSVNTSLILTFDANAYPAKFCNDYTGSGQTDWVLPTTNDLTSILPNNSLLTVPFNSNSNTQTTLYWTSHTTAFNTAQFVDFRTNEPSPYAGNIGVGFRCCGPTSPGPGLPFRPVRYFDYRT